MKTWGYFRSGPLGTLPTQDLAIESTLAICLPSLQNWVPVSFLLPTLLGTYCGRRQLYWLAEQNRGPVASFAAFFLYGRGSLGTPTSQFLLPAG